MTPKQQRFCDEYLVDLNATQAALRAGYSKKTAYSIGVENLRKPEIQAEIQKRQNRLRNKLEITQEKVLRELALSVWLLQDNQFWQLKILMTTFHSHQT